MGLLIKKTDAQKVEAFDKMRKFFFEANMFSNFSLEILVLRIYINTSKIQA